MIIRERSTNFSQRQLTIEQDWLIWISLLIGLIGLAGLIYHQGTSSAQAAMAQPIPPAKIAPVSSLNAIQAQAQITPQNPITPLDVVVVFDISGSVEDQTSCHDCWVRTSYNPDYPNNGYFNPLPYNPAWATAGTDNQSIPASGLCTVYPPQPHVQDGFQYLTVEAELYSRNASNWGLDLRVPGQGFFALQRGSKRAGNNALGENNDQNNQAGLPAEQSSNVCRPNILGAGSQGIDCTVGLAGNPGDNVCSSADGGIAVDCSAYIAARPMTSYNQQPGQLPYLNGAAYNSDCFTGGNLSGTCWSSNPFNTVEGLAVGPNSVPWVEYDFTPTWSGSTYIWMRVIGGGDEAFTWAGSSPDQIQPDLNGSGTGNNVAPWRKVIYWQVDNGTIFERKDNVNDNYLWTPDEENTNTVNANYHVQRAPSWRNSRAENDLWRWIRINDDDGAIRTINVTSGSQYTLKLYQGSAGYMIDKIVFTNDNSFSTPERGAPTTSLPNALKRDVSGNTTNTPPDMLGPPASLGSATREACNVCNPAYGYTVDPSQCSCKRTPASANDFNNGACTLVLTTTNQLQAQLQAGLYSGLQPLRSAQEAVKTLARQLDPQFDQLGLVPFTSSTDNTNAQADSTRRSKLQCLRWAADHTAGGAAECYDGTLFTNPISFTRVLSAVEKHWPNSGTNIAIGMREGLEELGINTPGNPVNSNCTITINNGAACDRRGAARRILILMTDGIPNTNPGSCNSFDLWDGLIGTEDTNFECAAYYAFLAAQNNVSVYTIGIGPAVYPDLLTLMATGIDPRGDQPDVPMFDAACGQYFNAAKPSDLSSSLFETILTQARNCVSSVPVLSLTKSATSAQITLGASLSYTLAVTNSGGVTAANVLITDALDSNVSFASASDGGFQNAGIVTWNVATILPNQTITRTLTVTVGNSVPGAVLTNTAWVTSNEGISHSSTATTFVTGLEQIWALFYNVSQSNNLLVHLENHYNLAGPYDIYLNDNNGNSFRICTGINTVPATNNGDFSCAISTAIPLGVYTLFSTHFNALTPLTVAPQQVEVVASPQIVVDNGVGGNIAAANSYIDISLIAHQPADQPFNLLFSQGLNSLLITTNLTATPGLITWQVPGSLSPCPPGGPPCLLQTRRVVSPTTVYASAEFFINQPEIVLMGGTTIYTTGETIPVLLQGHTPGLAYDLKLSNGVTAAWLGRTQTTNASGDTLTPVTWTIPLTWPSGIYTLTSHPAVGGAPRDPASMTSANQIAGLSNVQIITPLTCTDPLSENGFETPPLTHWILGDVEGVSVTPGSAHNGNFKLSAPTFDSSYHQPFFYQPFTMPASVISSANRLKLSLFKNINGLTDGNDPNDRFYAIVTTGPGLTSTHVTHPVEVANGVMNGASYNPADWRAINVLLLPPSGVNLADYAGQTVYLHFYNSSNAGCIPVPPFTNCHTSQFHFDDVSLNVCSTDTPTLNLPPSNPSPPAGVGELITYTLTVANNGSVDATGVVMTGTLDNRVNFVSASLGGQYNTSLVTWGIGTLPLGQTISRTLTVTSHSVISGTVLSHTISVSSTEGISASRIITSTVSGAPVPPSTTVYLPIILKQ